ncbi:protocadherin Fat 4-like [Haliotis cracherodii]|uniref:protocadherin Fat 4-like n=1 Tax=Haliotis cracherodii TaxID=6455 RepID=UPI0039EA9F1A
MFKCFVIIFKATSTTVPSSITSTATTSLSTTSTPTTTQTSSTASTATTRPPYIAITDVGLDQDCTHAHCSVIHSACVMDEAGDRRCECVQNYLKTVNGHCKQAPTMLVAKDIHDITVKGSQHVGDVVGRIPFISLADFSRSEFQITVNILPAGSGITAKVTPTDITLKSTSNTENTRTDIVLQIDAHVHYIHISQVVSVHIVFEEITIHTRILHSFLYEGTKAATIIGDTTQFTSRYGQSGYKLSITSNDKSDIVEALFLLQDSGQIVLKKDVALQGLTGSSLVASIEISFQVNLTRDSASEAVVLAVYHILILNDEYHYTIDENNSPNRAIMQNQLLGDSFFKIAAPGMSSVLQFQYNDVLVREQLDYEIVSDRETEFDLYVSTNDADGSTDVRMSGKLFVKNVNDEPPHFEESKLYLTVLSGSPKGTILGVIPVNDQDTPLSGLTLTINGPYSAYFIIDNGGTLSSSTDIHIGPSKFPHNFNFLVSASDGALTSDNYCIVDVTIKVANQHTTNLNMSFPATLPEESPIGTFVADVRQINYTNYLFTEREAYSYFHLNKTTGRVTTAKGLDREKSTDAHTDFGISGHMEDQDMCTFIIIGELHTTLSDINDNSPVFHCPACASVKVKENVETGYVLIEGSIQDDDEGKNGESNFIINNTSAFTIETSNGKSFKIRVNTTLDRETVSAYFLTIYAVDGAAGSAVRQTSSTYLNIKVEDVNDNPPVFTTTATSFGVQENHADVPVTTLNATDRDAGLNGKVSFLIKSGGLGFFSINNGTLKTTKGIDREAYASFDLNIVAFDSGSPQMSTYRNVTIDIIDVNDNAPVFHGIDGQVFQVEENTPCSTDIVTATATDLDTGNNSVIVYSLGGDDSHMFSVDSHTGGIRCKTPLDYETKSVYKDLILLATDQGQPPLNSTSAITVKVLDVNDNPPMFSKSSYEVNVTNTATKGSIPLLLLSVHDADSGENGNVSLSVASSQYPNLFTVTSNLIRLTTSPQLTNKDYVFNVIANDGGTPSLSATTTVTVHVDQSVSNGLKFKDTDFSFTAKENIDYTTKVIGNVSVTNSGGSTLTFSIDADFGKSNFSVNNAGDIFFAGTFDREIQDSYNLIVRVTQQGAADVAVVRVHVEDVNDNPPIFTLQSDQLIFSEPEDVNVDTVISTVTASDKDAGKNGHVTYSLHQLTDFSINPTKGELKVAHGLDADDPSRRSYNITITAKDNGSPRKRATVTATVLVIDVNDNSPVFSSPTYSFSVKENAAVNSEVSTIRATDNDYNKDTNGLVSYDMATSTQPCPFFIKEVSDPNTNDVQGSIQVKETLDYESVRAYTCMVTAHDNPERSSQKSSTATVNITVEDVNDNVPFFLNEPYIANVSREGAEKTFSFNVTADDVDTDAVNGQIQYSLADDLKTTNPLFKIDPFTGTVSVVDSLATVPDFFNLTITAKDTKHSNSTTLTINIIDNNQRPMFIKPKYNFNITEESEILKPLYLTKVTAKDDNKPTCNCTYEIDGSEYFTMDKTTGSVFQVKSVDRETTGSNIALHITATDHGSPPKSTATLLVINIVDVNDNAPFFSHRPQKFTVSQNAPINTVINHVDYTDKDEPSTSRPRFTTIFNTNNSIRLREDGALVVTRSLWNPEMESYTIRIVTQVLDSKIVTPALPEHRNYSAENNTAQVIITIHKKNNTYAPQFTQGTYTTELSTTARSSQEVPVPGFKAVDKDGDNITYAILSGNFRDTFRINNVTGAITLTYDIDVHVPHVISLTIKATDDAEVSKTGTCLVQITLEGSSSRQCYSPSELSRQVASNTSPQTQYIAPLGVTAGLLALAIIVCLVLIVKLRLTKRNDTSVTNATTNQTSYSNLSKARETPEPYEQLSDPNRFSEEPVNNPGYISHDRSRTSACAQPPPPPREPRPFSDEQLYRRDDGGRSYDDRERSRLPRY